MRRMTIEEWDEEFKPMVNPFDLNASFDGTMFETFDKELGFVLGVNSTIPTKVWTYVDGDNGTYIVDGYQLVNRIGYFITQKARQDDQFYEVIVSQEGEDEVPSIDVSKCEPKEGDEDSFSNLGG